MHLFLDLIHLAVSLFHEGSDRGIPYLGRIGKAPGNAHILETLLGLKPFDPLFDIFYPHILKYSGKLVSAEPEAVVFCPYRISPLGAQIDQLV